MSDDSGSIKSKPDASFEIMEGATEPPTLDELCGNGSDDEDLIGDDLLEDVF